MIIQDLQLILVSNRDVGEVFIIAAVYIRGIGLPLLVSQVVPVGGGEGQLDVLDLGLGNQTFQEVELISVCASLMFDLACADDGFPFRSDKSVAGRTVPIKLCALAASINCQYSPGL
jgi:hypothetical protein